MELKNAFDDIALLHCYSTNLPLPDDERYLASLSVLRYSSMFGVGRNTDVIIQGFPDKRLQFKNRTRVLENFHLTYACV